jgi:hypothetical protein
MNLVDEDERLKVSSHFLISRQCIHPNSIMFWLLMLHQAASAAL